MTTYSRVILSFVLLSFVILSLILSGCSGNQQDDANQQDSDTTATTSKGGGQATGQESSKAETIQNKALHKRLEAMMNNAKNANCKRLATHLVYTGDDKQRKYSDKLNLQNEAEKYRVQSTCEAISSWLEGSNDYRYGSYRLESHSVIDTLYRQEVVFLRNAGSSTKIFTFLKKDSEYLLVNIQ